MDDRTIINTVAIEHMVWLERLDAFRMELKNLEQRLAGVASRRHDFEARQGMEHFQNQFLIQRINMDEVRHRIHQREDSVAWRVVPAPGHECFRDGQEHDGIKRELDGLMKVWDDLRSDFNRYLIKWS